MDSTEYLSSRESRLGRIHSPRTLIPPTIHLEAPNHTYLLTNQPTKKEHPLDPGLPLRDQQCWNSKWGVLQEAAPGEVGKCGQEHQEERIKNLDRNVTRGCEGSLPRKATKSTKVPYSKRIQDPGKSRVFNTGRSVALREGQVPTQRSVRMNIEQTGYLHSTKYRIMSTPARFLLFYRIPYNPMIVRKESRNHPVHSSLPS